MTTRTTQAAPTPAAPARRRVLFAPVPIAPTKPLTLSHVKGLLWSDVLHRATGLLHDADQLHSWTVAVANAQTLGFWAHLDRTRPGADYTALDEEAIGHLYVAYQRGAASGHVDAAPDDLTATARRYAAGGLHPASARVYDLWALRHAELGIPDPGLRTHRRPPLALDPLIETLERHGLCVDHRPLRGPAYLDGTAGGVPLRQLVSAEGHPNYLAGLLRELVPLIGAYDSFVLVCDEDSAPDYRLVRYVLRRLGMADVALVSVGRVRTDPTAARALSSRHGGWEGHTAAALAERFLDRVGERVYRLGLRLYFLALLGKGDRVPHRYDLVWRCMARAARLLDTADAGIQAPCGTGPPPYDELLRRTARPHPYVDPYRLTTALLGRDGTAVDPGLLKEVYL
ncbi:hypothetical protein [Streptomyces kanamyceticus]|uniref:Uncharacterized protein n=1 Tax=Streptomyces kanamyceticus TaxID=1967 RepID=A0A5J6GS73_STRKN|nr:hypothetical protein [Streptomyces kanamyceticus]QEU97234.1 hypothetical protein CP970_09655 [Streptomyces kanamyceticus]